MIPESFQILGQKIQIIFDDKFCHKHKCYGMYLSFENKIILAKKYKTAKGWFDYNEDIILATFYHELIHCLLFYAGSDQWLNEELVDKIGNFLHQFETTKKI
jgi:hypothetical protein